MFNYYILILISVDLLIYMVIFRGNLEISGNRGLFGWWMGITRVSQLPRRCKVADDPTQFMFHIWINSILLTLQL